MNNTMTKADRTELSGYLASKLVKRGLVAQDERYIAKLLAGYVDDFITGANDPDWCYFCDRPKNDCACDERGDTDDLSSEAYEPDDFRDNFFTRDR